MSKKTKMLQIENYQDLCRAIEAYKRCFVNNNELFEQLHLERIDNFIDSKMPSGSGIGAITIDIDKCNKNKIVFHSSYMVYDENGYYNKTIEFKLIVSASLMFEYDLQIVGRFGKSQDIKEYLYDTFSL